MRSALLGVMTQCRVVIPYHCFRTNISPICKCQEIQGEGLLDFLTLEEGTDSCPETLMRNYNSMLHNIPDER